MARRIHHNHRKTGRKSQVWWLPVDSWLVTPFFAFGRVKGIAKIFLQIEMVIALGVVFGSLLLLGLRLVGLQ